MKNPHLDAPHVSFAEKHYLDELPPRLLDVYLAHGWYRMGQSIFTTHFLSFRDGILSAIWTRLDLQGYSFRKSLRKLMRRNGKHFTYRFQPAVIDYRREELFQRYRADFPAELSPNIEEYLLEGMEKSVFDTWEVDIYDDDKLIAVSYFDRGVEGVESIIGIYDPEYKARSLGFYSMLLEIVYCQENGIRYFYPGYVAPGNSRFDYKLRIGPVEYYDLETLDWRPYAELDLNEIPLEKMRTRLEAMQAFAGNQGHVFPLLFNPIFEANLISYLEEEPVGSFLDYPIMLFCGRSQDSGRFYIIVYDPRSSSYKLLCCLLSLQLWFHFHQAIKANFDPEEFLQIPLSVEEVVAMGNNPEELYHRLQPLLQVLKP